MSVVLSSFWRGLRPWVRVGARSLPQFLDQQIGYFLYSHVDGKMTNRRRHSGKLGVIDSDGQTVFFALLLKGTRLRTPSLVGGPHSLRILFRDEHYAVAGTLPVDLIKEHHEIFPHKSSG